MPLGSLEEIITAGPTSRKRAYEQITRSTSRSVTPPPSKRRRTTIPQSRSTSPFLQMSTRQPSPAQRFAGDGLDHRRPAPSAIEQAEQHTTIDLTLEDEEEELNRRRAASSPVLVDVVPRAPPSLASASNSRAHSRARRSQHNPRLGLDAEVIDITGDPDENEQNDDRNSDVEFVRERQLPRPRLPMPRELERRRRSPSSTAPGLRRSNAQSFHPPAMEPFVNFLGLENPFRPGEAFHTPRGGLMDRVSSIMRAGFAGHPVPAPLDLEVYDDDVGLSDYDDIQMDYGAAAFVIQDPGADEPPPSDYKTPAPAQVGYTRDIEEEGDVLVCVGCDEELGSGTDETKQQVWISKKCGHAYCGECASRRVVYRQGNDRDRSKAKQRKLNELRECSAEGCKRRLTAKTALFQIYL